MLSLDVGCGHNKQAEIGVDLKKGLCDIQASAHNLPFRNSVFSGVILSHSLEHFINAGQALREIHRVTKPDAKLRIAVPNPHTIWQFKNIIQRKWSPEDCSHVASYNPNQLNNLLRQTGFKITNLRYYVSKTTLRIIRESRFKVSAVFYRTVYMFFPRFRPGITLEAERL